MGKRSNFFSFVLLFCTALLSPQAISSRQSLETQKSIEVPTLRRMHFSLPSTNIFQTYTLCLFCRMLSVLNFYENFHPKGRARFTSSGFLLPRNSRESVRRHEKIVFGSNVSKMYFVSRNSEISITIYVIQLGKFRQLQNSDENRIILRITWHLLLV